MILDCSYMGQNKQQSVPNCFIAQVETNPKVSLGQRSMLIELSNYLRLQVCVVLWWRHR